MAWIKGDNPKEQKHFNFLEELRQSGVTNMFGAGAYLRREFPGDLPPQKGFHDDAAGSVLARWMKFHDHPDRLLTDKPVVRAKKKRSCIL
jgi:hypothetical protein